VTVGKLLVVILILAGGAAAGIVTSRIPWIWVEPVSTGTDGVLWSRSTLDRPDRWMA
jgi:hypothetical protein